MSRSYSVAGARAKLAQIVDEVAAGRDVELTRRGRKVAVVMSADRYARLCDRKVLFATAYDEFVKEHELDEGRVAPGWDRQIRDRHIGRSVKL